MNSEKPNLLDPLENLKSEHFDFTIPSALVAHAPLSQRDQSRLLIYESPGIYHQTMVKNLADILPKGAVLIFNNSRVFPSRLLGTLATGGGVEVFLTKELVLSESHKCRWWALGRPLKKLTPGKVVSFAATGNRGQTDCGLTAVIVKRQDDQVLLEFEKSATSVNEWIDQWGIIPLPPYIHRDQAKPALESPDRMSYQTVFAKDRGSVAAPTAGLHFSEHLLNQLSEKGIQLRFLSLHVGAGTFLPVKSDVIQNHRMHHESFMVPRQTLHDIFQAKQDGAPVIAVGTTSLRSLEDLYRKGTGNPDQILSLGNQWHETNLFLYPTHKDDRYTPWMIDGLLTNFHQPKSTLFMLISLLMGLDNAKQFYQFAFDNQFRLFSYGDSSLLWLRKPQKAV